jgi:gliding motility-associated-like protein
MKNFIYFFLFGFASLLMSLWPSEAQAAHLIGGEITYEYIGNAANPHRYRVTVVLHRTTRWTTFDGVTGGALCVRSSCFPNQNVPLSIKAGTPAQGQPVPNQAECVQSNNTNFTPVIEHFLEGTVDLPGLCADYTFGYVFVCCRIGVNNITNYSGNGPGGSQNYIEAKLNNTQGPNTSASFLAPPAKSFCLNNFFNWSQGASEPDNDSIQYDLGTAMNATGACAAGQNMIFQAPYNRLQPLNVATGTSMIVRSNGIIEFTTGTVPGNYIVVVIVKELRLHPSGGFYYEVGSVMREMLVNLVDNCLPGVQNGPTFDLNHPTVSSGLISTSALGVIGNNYPHPNADSVPDPNSSTGYSMLLPIINYPCFDSLITLHFQTFVQCPSITPDGSEFRLTGPDSNLVPINRVTANCNAALETRQVDLHLLTPMATEGDYYMYIKEGDDGNTLLNACGFEMAEFFLLVIRVNNCPDPEYDITNVSVLNNDHIQIFWEPDTTTFPRFAVSGWYFFRSDDNGNTFNRVGDRRGANAGFQDDWIDYSVDNDDVNSRNHRYQIQMEISNTFFHFTRDVTSIFLEKGPGYGTGTSWNILWNEYDGWTDPEYTLMIWDIDSTGTWAPVAQPGNPTQANTMQFDYLTVANRPGDNFAMRIDAKNPNFSGIDYTASSNYIYLTVPNVPPPPPPPDGWAVEDLNIPNVFTPNGDGKNDIFSIRGIEGFRSAEVIFTNRWGNVVYQNDKFQRDNAWDGRDMRTGQMVSDGTYFYIIRLRGSVLGLPDVEETGALQIFSGSR